MPNNTYVLRSEPNEAHTLQLRRHAQHVLMMAAMSARSSYMSVCSPPDGYYAQSVPIEQAVFPMQCTHVQTPLMLRLNKLRFRGVCHCTGSCLRMRTLISCLPRIHNPVGRSNSCYYASQCALYWEGGLHGSAYACCQKQRCIVQSYSFDWAIVPTCLGWRSTDWETTGCGDSDIEVFHFDCWHPNYMCDLFIP